MRVVSLFAGIGGFDLGFERAGAKTVATVEINAHCRKLLADKWPDAVHLDDVRTAGRHNLPECDVITFGFPCQDLSVAGKREGLRGERSGLFYEAMRIIDELQPAWAVWENVPGLLSSDNGRDLARELFRLGQSGYHGCVRCLDAQWLGVAQRRRRLFGVFTRLGSGAERCAEILSVAESLRGHPAPRREAGQDAAGCLASRTDGGGFPGTDEACGGYVQPVSAFCIKGAAIGRKPEAGPQYGEVLEDICYTQNCVEQHAVAHTLRGDGFDASEDGTGRGTPLVPVGVTIHGTDPTVQKVASYDELAQCLRARTPGNIDNSSTTVVQQPVSYGIRTANTSSNGWGIQEECTHTLDCAQGVAVAVALRGREGGATAELGDEVQNCLRASGGGGDKAHVLAPVATFQQSSMKGKGTIGYDDSGVSKPVKTQVDGQMVHAAMQVRRLTPVECEKLQGFPPGYTAIPWRKKPASDCPDGPRYKALGNSWAVPCVRWIGQRIQRVIRAKELG